MMSALGLTGAASSTGVVTRVWGLDSAVSLDLDV